MQKLFNTAQNALSESSYTIEKLRQLKESQSVPTSPKQQRKLSLSSSWGGDEKHVVTLIQRMKLAVADTFQNAA